MWVFFFVIIGYFEFFLTNPLNLTNITKIKKYNVCGPLLLSIIIRLSYVPVNLTRVNKIN